MSFSPRINTRWKPLRRFGRWLYASLPEINFITLHYLYFIGTSLLASLILWGSATPHGSLHYTDALFLVISAMTEAGLNTVNLSGLNTFQQIVLFVLIMIGSAIFVSAFVVLVRRRAFDERFKHLARKRNRWARKSSTSGPIPQDHNDAQPQSSYQLSRILTHRSEECDAQSATMEQPVENANDDVTLPADPSDIKPQDLPMGDLNGPTSSNDNVRRISTQDAEEAPSGSASACGFF